MSATEQQALRTAVEIIDSLVELWGMPLPDDIATENAAKYDFIKSAIDENGGDPTEGGVGPFSKDSPTSRQAALDNYPRRKSQRWKVLVAICYAKSRGCTRDELAGQLELPDSSTDARVWELLQGDWIEKTLRTRTTQHGSKAAVLVATERAHRYVKDKEGI